MGGFSDERYLKLQDFFFFKFFLNNGKFVSLKYKVYCLKLCICICICLNRNYFSKLEITCVSESQLQMHIYNGLNKMSEKSNCDI